jgi:D-alanine-D-alanine ligase
MALETLGVPLTGCSAQVLALAGAKHRAKATLSAAGLPTPKCNVIRAAPRRRCELCWPVIAKMALYHASIGIEQASVATNDAQLSARIETLLGRYRGPVLVEEFVAGREFTVTVIELPRCVALPAMEFEFTAAPHELWPLVTYDAKWRPESREYLATPARHAASITVSLERKLADLACRAFRTLGCRDYARVDFRVDNQGQPWILEVNSNPDLSPAACLAGALAAAGYDYEEFIVSLAQRALRRAGAALLQKGEVLPAARP